MPVLQLKPACKSYLWGGTRLKHEYGKQFEGDTLAETWELSCHPDGESVIVNGSYAGQTLTHYLAQAGKEALGTNCARFDAFPILIKLIDAKNSLSIQVHPNNAYALLHEKQYGKTEMWYIVDAAPDAFLYYGFEETIRKEEFRRRIEDDTLLEVLHKAHVKKGDVFFIEAGTLHAIGKDILIAEIQQSSNVTYRVYDYGRKGPDGKPRALHIDKAVEVTHTCPARNDYNFGPHLASCDYFTVDRLTVNGVHGGMADDASFHSLLVLEGTGNLLCGDQAVAFGKGDSLFLPAGSGVYSIHGSAVLLCTTVGAKEKKYRIGIDLGGTNIKVGIVNRENEIIAKKSVKTHAKRPWQEILADMANAVRAALCEAGVTREECIGIGVGSPGTVDAATGNIVYSNNLAWENVPLGADLQERLDLPVWASNDANCAALGEVCAGAAKGCKNAVLITLGTGVGGGVIIDGKIFEGGSAGGAELGHTCIVADGAPCTCGRNGCMEAYASATGLARMARQAATAHPESKLNELCKGDLDNMNGAIPFVAARQGDAPAQQVVDDYLRYLGEGITNFVNIFRPEKVLLGGGICNEGDALFQPVDAFVKTHSFAGNRVFTPDVVRAQLGNDAGIIGAANLVQE